MNKLLWWLIFVFVLIVGDRAASYFLQKQIDNSQFRYSRMYRGAADADILLVGNSRGLTFYQPHIEKITGKKTFNLSYNGLPMDAARVLVEDYLEKYPAPQHLILDITAADRENDELLSGFLTYSIHSQRLSHLIQEKQTKFWWGAQVSHLTRFNNEIFQRAWFHRSHSDENWILDRVISPQLAAQATHNHYPLEVHPYLIEQLKYLVAAAQVRGVQVHLVVSPYFPNFEVKNLQELKMAVENATHLNVLDYQNLLNDPLFFGDFMHPNLAGSRVYLDSLFFQLGIRNF